MKNKVLESTRFLIESPEHVHIDEEQVDKTAKRFSQEELSIPPWDLPIYMSGTSKHVIDFFFLANSINFAYTDFKTGVKFAADYYGQEWRGACGMFACLKKALAGEEGYPLLSARFLKTISKRELKEVFKGNIEIPLFEERWKIFREVGRVLEEKYDGHFYNLVEQSGGRLFNNGYGIVERLTSDFPSFDDSVQHQGREMRFDKRAQLAPGMIYGRFLANGSKLVEDVDELTVFADYVLPKTLRALGILKYKEGLAHKVDNQELIPQNSQEELEIRASTIHASQMLIDGINELRRKSKDKKEKVNALHLDYKLWSEGRKKQGNHHLTITTAY